MKYTKFLLTAALGTAAAFVAPTAAFAKEVPVKSGVRPELTYTDRERFALKHLESGRARLATAATLKSDAAKLNKLDQAIVELRRARTEAMKGSGQTFFDIRSLAERKLVGALDDQADIYTTRGSLRSAEKRIDTALAVIPYDDRTLALKARVDELQAQGSSYSRGYNRSVMDRRIGGRRAGDAAAPNVPVNVPQGTTNQSGRDDFSKAPGVTNKGPGAPASPSNYSKAPANR